MWSAPYHLYSVCALSLKLSKILRSSNQESFAPVAACLVVHRQTCELILLHQRALRSNRLEVTLPRPPSSLLGAAENSVRGRWGGDNGEVVWEWAVLWERCFKPEILTFILSRAVTPGLERLYCSDRSLQTQGRWVMASLSSAHSFSLARLLMDGKLERSPLS